MPKMSPKEPGQMFHRLRREPDPEIKRSVLARHFDDAAQDRDRWKRRNRYYHRQIEKLTRSLIVTARHDDRHAVLLLVRIVPRR